ncbi:facilitated trehalose transporter Tret1 isoform X1 [Halyomorpha halys]|uniref:facilitated trehalose transporter Tret1 isoform X1 n=1 Tax=Halyomorpha halys TaxID=286706 RepID=UPI0006D51DBE|nr:facilitated trehalose transporter Tret1-like isoform X1 [Halyomorpha halys]XP_024213999.1 facilitated trehalose transporter Tret1-like isoform X1 [Halyomorpha halys]
MRSAIANQVGNLNRNYLCTFNSKKAEVMVNGSERTVILASNTKPHYFSQVLAALALALGPLAAGLGKGYSSPAIASLQEKQQFAIYTGNFTNILTINPQQASWVASLSLLGALFGGMFGGIAMKFGRRKVLLITSIPFSASWLVTVFAKNIEMMFATGFIGGFCCAIILMVSQVYISEIAVPDIRGCLSAVLKIFGHVGVLISFAVGAYLDWRELAMVIGCAPLIFFISVAYMPETPSYLVLVGKEQEAARSLQWFRGPHADVGKELLTIRNNVLAAHSDRFRNPNRHAVITILNPILVTCGLMMFQRFSGANAFNFYAVSIFKKTFGAMDPHSGAVAVAFVQLLSSLLSGLLIDTVGRLPLLIASSVFMSMALAGFGSFVYYENINRSRGLVVAQYDWIPLLCVLVFTVAFSMGISPISWLLIGELFPLEYRGLGSALATSFSYACAFVGVKTFVDFQEIFGLHGAFWFYSAVSIGSLCFIICFVPETKGKDLSEMNSRNVNYYN